MICSIYEKAYLRVIEECKANGDDFHRQICEDICVVIRRELDSHVRRQANLENRWKNLRPRKQHAITRIW